MSRPISDFKLGFVTIRRSRGLPPPDGHEDGGEISFVPTEEYCEPLRKRPFLGLTEHQGQDLDDDNEQEQ